MDNAKVDDHYDDDDETTFATLSSRLQLFPTNENNFLVALAIELLKDVDRQLLVLVCFSFLFFAPILEYLFYYSNCLDIFFSYSSICAAAVILSIFSTLYFISFIKHSYHLCAQLKGNFTLLLFFRL